MTRKPPTAGRSEAARRPQRPAVSLSAIRRFAQQVAERFRPDKIILFGSRAYGTPHADSDVDLLVVMAARDAHSQAVKIRLAIERGFPLDLIVRTPEELRWRLEAGDWFLREIVAKGRILYDKAHARVGGQGRKRLSRRANPSPRGHPRP